MSEYYGNNDWRDYLAHHGVKGQKWGQRNGPPYPLSRTAKQIHSKAQKNERLITNDVKYACSVVGGKMYSLKNRLKTKQSIERKMVAKNTKNIKDALRYTMIFDNDYFVDNYFHVKKELLNKGYSETACENYFKKFEDGLVKHKSVQSNYKAPNGYEFEIQFHTPDSQKIKDKKTPLYEEVRNPNTSSKRKQEIEQQMYDLALYVPNPMDIDRIKSHK